MKLEKEEFGIDILKIDWSSLSEKDKDDIINEQIIYLALTRKVAEANGAYSANFISLILSLFVSFIMVLSNIDSRTIALTIISLQFIKTLLSRLVEVNIVGSLILTKRNLSNSLLKKVKK